VPSSIGRSRRDVYPINESRSDGAAAREQDAAQGGRQAAYCSTLPNGFSRREIIVSLK